MQPAVKPPKPLIIIFISPLVIIGVGTFALANRASAPVSDPVADQQSTSPETSDQGAPAPSNRAVIKFTDGGFEPKDITVKKGTIINVRNESSKPVQFSSDDHPAHRDNTEMNMGRLAPGESMSYTADRTGTWGYHDHIDETKTGTITVEE